MQRSFLEKSQSGWGGVEREGYVPGETTAVVRHTLIGHKKESVDDPGPSSEVRYFDVPPGAVTRLEKHEHEHYVIIGAGVGYAIVGDDVREVRLHDIVYVAPWEPHQFINRGDAHFGFFCIVPACRDMPQLLSEAELARLNASPAGPYADPRRRSAATSSSLAYGAVGLPGRRERRRYVARVMTITAATMHESPRAVGMKASPTPVATTAGMSCLVLRYR